MHRVSQHIWLVLFVTAFTSSFWKNQPPRFLVRAEEETSMNEVSVVTCKTTKGEMELTFYRDWSPNGYDRAVELFRGGFYDKSHFFRVVPRFLCQFGISYSRSEALQAKAKTPIPDDPINKVIPFEPGTISFAGSGPNSRTSHLFISFMKSGQFGTNPWESPVGQVTKGMEQTVSQFYAGYGDMPPWGNGPEQGPIYKGPQYIEQGFPLLDKFLTCKVETKMVKGSNIPPVSMPSEDDDSSEDDEHEDANAHSESDEEEHHDDSSDGSDSDSDDGGGDEL